MSSLDDIRVEMEDFIENTANRVPVCIVVDTSFSMNIENRIEHVNNGIKAFIHNSAEDEYAVDSLDLCIVSFDNEGGRESATVVHPFTNEKMKFACLIVVAAAVAFGGEVSIDFSSERRAGEIATLVV